MDRPDYGSLLKLVHHFDAEELRRLENSAEDEPNERGHVGCVLIAVDSRRVDLVVAPSGFEFTAAIFGRTCARGV